MFDSKKRKPGPYGPWNIKTTETVYVDPFVEVQLDQVVRPDRQDGQHVVVLIKPGVCVLPIDKEKNVFLTNEFHYAIGRDSLEGVSGGIEMDIDATPLETAQRELAEELGLAAEKWHHLTTVDPFTTPMASPTELYVATGLSEVPRAPEGTELIEKVKLPLNVAKQKVISGEITHAPTCVLLLLAADQLDSLL